MEQAIALPSMSVGKALATVHDELRQFFPGVTRLAVALYDPASGHLKTFVNSTEGENPLPIYEAPLDQVPSLVALARERRARIIDDLCDCPPSDSVHARGILAAGYRSSYTTPIFDGETLLGFIFLDAPEPAYFSQVTVHRLWVFVQLIRLGVVAVLSSVRMLVSAVRLASGLSRFRDRETGAHMERMAHYSRLIARSLARERGLSDEYVEYVYVFAPLHDVGKIGIPDAVLQKPDRLSPEEFAVMQRHVVVGAEIIDRMLAMFGLTGRLHGDLLRNIVLYHHEAYDGTGYVGGLAGDAIPLEARIVTVADVYDALTSKRTYKEPWEAERAFAFLAEQAGAKFDPDCVRALAENRSEVEEIAVRLAGEAEEEPGYHEAYFEWL